MQASVLKRLKEAAPSQVEAVLADELERKAVKGQPQPLKLAEFASVFVRLVDDQRGDIGPQAWCAPSVDFINSYGMGE